MPGGLCALTRPSKYIRSYHGEEFDLSLSKQINEYVLEAGKIAYDYFGRVSIDFKEDNSVVTEADLAVEKFLGEKLMALVPGSSFLGEEGVTGAERDGNGYLWIVDPIDGTSGYSKGLPVWGVSVALVNKNEPYLASLYFPVINAHYWCDDNGISYFNGSVMKPLNGNGRPGPDAFVCLPSNIANDCGVSVRLKSRAFGSSCYHILQVARDAAYATILCGLGLWDIAGAHTIAELLGARIYDINCKKYSLSEIIRTRDIPEPLIICHPDRLENVKALIRYI